MTAAVRTLKWLGGRWWQCTNCGTRFTADCECCEPQHACGERR